jgi:hypothetical protein
MGLGIRYWLARQFSTGVMFLPSYTTGRRRQMCCESGVGVRRIHKTLFDVLERGKRDVGASKVVSVKVRRRGGVGACGQW